MRIMKKFLLSFSFIFLAFAAFATINGNGFYRVQNYGSQRWGSLIDDYGTADLVAGTADLHALQLNKDFQEILSDPGSIVYLTNVSGYRYNVAAQGTSLESLIDHEIFIRSNGTAPNGQSLYRIYGTYKNVTKYIMDGQFIDSRQYGTATINDANAPTFRQWLFLPVDVNTDNFFGTVPTLTINNNYYTTLFTSFGYKPVSGAVKAYYIGRVGFGMAEMIEISGAVPPGSPVIIKCAGTTPADNKLNLTGAQDALPNNALRGVYFNYSGDTHVNHTKYDPSTMRILGKCSDGSLGFITSNIDYIPANTAYLLVPAGSSPEFKCVSTAEYDANTPEAPEGFYSDETIILYPNDAYTYSGSWNFPAFSADQKKSFRFFTTEASANTPNSVIGVYNSYGKDYVLNLTKNENLPFSYGSQYSWVLTNWPGGDLNITLNLQYQYIQFYSRSAGIDTVIANDSSSINFIGQSIYAEEGALIEVFNLAGRKIDSSYSGKVDLTGWPKGIYIAKSGNRSLKIIL